VAADLERLEGEFRQSIAADGMEAATAMTELFAAGGKRLRPALVLLFAKLGSYDFQTVRHGAMAVEFVHASTLVHDDVIDRSPLRRGRPTILAQRGQEAAILIGDYYFAKAYGEASATGRADVVAELAGAVMRMCEGELVALSDRWAYHRDWNSYWAHVVSKTGALMAAACRIGALLGGLATAVDAAGEYGMLLGKAFQVVDDVLDYTGESAEVGKPVGHDLFEGTVTFPLLVAFTARRDRLDALLTDGRAADEPTVAAVVEIVRESGAPEQALETARTEAAAAVEALASMPDSEARQTLENLATYVVERKL
jgi:geranylgeranyl pyrophosphate synthase